MVTKRIRFFDSIRGLAALFVLLSHTFGFFSWPSSFADALSWPYLFILIDGKAAVCMFFVLSGYVLSKPYIPSADLPTPRKIFLPAFYLRRVTRIWFPWFFAFIVSILCQKFLFRHFVTNPAMSEWGSNFWQHDLTIGDFFRQCAFLLHDTNRQLLSQDWSLGVELKGSLLIPLFLALSCRPRLFWMVAVAAAFLICLPTGHYYVSFIIGVLLARYAEQIVARVGKNRFKLKLLALIFGLTLYQGLQFAVRLQGEFTPLYKLGWIVTSVGCALVLLATLSSARLQVILERRPLVYLGEISYSVYLLQFIVILCLLPRLVFLANQYGIDEYPILLFLTLSASLLATIGSAAIAYELVEKQSMQLGHWLTSRIQRRA